MAKRFWSNNVA